MENKRILYTVNNKTTVYEVNSIIVGHLVRRVYVSALEAQFLLNNGVKVYQTECHFEAGASYRYFVEVDLTKLMGE